MYVKSCFAALLFAGAVSMPAQAQWEDNGDGSSMLVLHPDDENVIVIDEGVDYVRYGVWYPAENPSDPDEYIEFDVQKETWNRFDINSTGATDSDEEKWGWPDNRVDWADVRLFMCLYQSQSLYADVNTTGAVLGDSNYGELDGIVDSSDLSFFTQWLSDFMGATEAMALVTESLASGDPCTTLAADEPALAPGGATPKVTSAGTTVVVQGAFPDVLKNWRYILARDPLKPQSSLDLNITHWADKDEICEGDPAAVHYPWARSEVNFIAKLGAVAGDITEVLNNRQYVIEDDIVSDGCGPTIGDSTLRTMYYMTFKRGIFLPINRAWAGIGTDHAVLTRQISGYGCSCP